MSPCNKRELTIAQEHNLLSLVVIWYVDSPCKTVTSKTRKRTYISYQYKTLLHIGIINSANSKCFRKSRYIACINDTEVYKMYHRSYVLLLCTNIKQLMLEEKLHYVLLGLLQQLAFVLYSCPLDRFRDCLVYFQLEGDRKPMYKSN